MKESYVFYKDRLSGSYLSVFEKIEMYVLTQGFDEAAYEERLSELLDIFLTAEADGQPVEKIVGNDIPQFCRTFCSDFGTKNRILSVVDFLCFDAVLLLIFSAADIIFFFLDHDEGTIADIWSSYPGTNIFGLIIGIVASGVITAVTGAVIRTAMFRMKNISMGALKAARAVAVAMTFLIFFAAMQATETVPFRIPSFIVIAVTVPYLIAYHFLRGRHIKRGRVSFSELVNENMQEQVALEMERAYDKKKRRREKSGKTYSLKDFLEYAERKCRWTERICAACLVLPPILTAHDILSNMPETFTLSDIVFEIVLGLAIRYAILLWLRKISLDGVKEQRAWLAQKKREIEGKEGE